MRAESFPPSLHLDLCVRTAALLLRAGQSYVALEMSSDVK
jgi:hypothetical protein